MSRLASPQQSSVSISPEEKERLSHESRGPMVLGVIFGFYGLSVVLVSLRIYVRTRISKQARSDDWILLGSEVVCSVLMVFYYYQIHYGDGKHLANLTVEDADRIAKMNFGALILWTLSITGAKVSILLQYMRWFYFRRTTRMIWVLMVFVVLYGISTLVVVLTTCIPLQAVWNTAIRNKAKCLNQRLYWLIQTAFEAANCWIMLGMLVPTLWRLQLSTAKKIGVIVLLGLSSSLLRLKATIDALPQSALVVHDFTWTGIFTTLYAALELLLGICCCSVPALMPLRHRILPCCFKKEQVRMQHAVESPPQLVKRPAAQPLLPTCSWDLTGAAVSAQQDSLPECEKASNIEIRQDSVLPCGVEAARKGDASSVVLSNDSSEASAAGKSLVEMPAIKEIRET